LAASLSTISCPISFLSSFHITATPDLYTLSLHDALPIWIERAADPSIWLFAPSVVLRLESRIEIEPNHFEELVIAQLGERLRTRSEEHTSELQSPDHLVCRLLLEKKNKTKDHNIPTYRTT